MGNIQENTGLKQERSPNGRYTKGTSGNPKGKPKGTRNKATRTALELMNGQLEAITQKLIDKALDGDLTAIKLILERIIPVQKEMPITANLPAMTTVQDLPKLTESILQAVCRGELLPGQAIALGGLLTVHSKALEIAELEKRISNLEI